MYANIRSRINTLGAQFTETEAWNLFRLAAFGEAIGWTLLISGICLSRFALGGNHDPISIAGQLHGLLFTVYLAAVLVLASSLRWSWRKIIIALAFSIPPYGTLIFEKWAATTRRLKQSHEWRQVSVWAIIFNGNEVLAVQPNSKPNWQLPGGLVQSELLAQDALQGLVTLQLGQPPTVGQLRYIAQGTHHGQPTLDMYFIINNPKDFRALKNLSYTGIDEVRFIDPTNNPDLEPAFLQKLRPSNVYDTEFMTNSD